MFGGGVKPVTSSPVAAVAPVVSATPMASIQ